MDLSVCRPCGCNCLLGVRSGLFGLDFGFVWGSSAPNRPKIEPEEAPMTPRRQPEILDYSHMAYSHISGPPNTAALAQAGGTCCGAGKHGEVVSAMVMPEKWRSSVPTLMRACSCPHST